jgi:predicted RNase H-like HicB family nuclease
MAKYTAVFEQADDGTWGGYFPDLSGLLVNGATLEEFWRMLGRVLSSGWKVRRKKVFPFPLRPPWQASLKLQPNR